MLLSKPERQRQLPSQHQGMVTMENMAPMVTSFIVHDCIVHGILIVLQAHIHLQREATSLMEAISVKPRLMLRQRRKLYQKRSVRQTQTPKHPQAMATMASILAMVRGSCDPKSIDAHSATGSYPAPKGGYKSYGAYKREAEADAEAEAAPEEKREAEADAEAEAAPGYGNYGKYSGYG
jgi:hypothetical protein